MAQTTAGMSWISARVFVNALGVDFAWTNITGQGASIGTAGGERATGEQNTMDGDLPIVKSGKRSSRELTCRFVYTETATEAFEIVRAIYEASGGVMYVQYQPQPLGNWFKTGKGICTNLMLPGGDAGEGTVIMSEFVVRCAEIAKAAASDAGASA